SELSAARNGCLWRAGGHQHLCDKNRRATAGGFRQHHGGGADGRFGCRDAGRRRRPVAAAEPRMRRAARSSVRMVGQPRSGRRGNARRVAHAARASRLTTERRTMSDITGVEEAKKSPWMAANRWELLFDSNYYTAQCRG